ncbi:endo alpha-1,4 polygalactosaminidase [Krasilnikovia cinnamomea]|uniref:endo alpha-1,4 polygalactosaminidase n=1 Tax=Krasilnikovia cinnamomea TaxID=349313 RepID=UPI001F5EB37E|nr:endo alpha-1,4 polygalactosaminidase [Krasilnikovia cinnamomea]
MLAALLAFIVAVAVFSAVALAATHADAFIVSARIAGSARAVEPVRVVEPAQDGWAAEPAGPGAPTRAVAAPPPNAKFDYQIGGAYQPPAGVQVVSRDRKAAPAGGVYTICYVNAFQVQPDELPWWQSHHEELLLKDANGRYVIDQDWGENLLDISTAAKRAAVAAVVNGWIDGCAANGFRAVEPDNLDSYDRSQGLLTRADAMAFVNLLATHAHAAGLAIGQKNTAELGTSGRDAGLDFAVVEECGQYSECGDYTAVYGNNVIDIEYTKQAFTKACRSHGATLSIVRRDRDVTVPGSGSYVYDAC